MEIRDGFVQRSRRIIRQQPLEIAERHSALIEIFRLLHLIIACSICDKLIRSPVVPFGIYIIGSSVLIGNGIQSLPVRVSSVLDDLLSQISGNSNYIFHQINRVIENLSVHSLKDHLDDSHISDLKCEKECIVNVSAPIGSAVFQSSHVIKIRDCFSDLQLGYSSHFYSSHSFSGYTP